MNKTLFYLTLIFRPNYWFMDDKYSAAWDAELSRLLDEGHTFKNVTDYTATLGEYKLWIDNQPYATMVPLDSVMGTIRFRASRYNTYRAIKLFENPKNFEEQVSRFILK